MKNTNLWLSDYIDYSLVDDESVNILVNDSSIAKFNSNKKTSAVSSLHWLTSKELLEFSDLKKKWSSNFNEVIASMFSQKLKIHGIDSSYSIVLERLFFDSQLACLDAIKFAQSYAENAETNTTLRIIVGDNYQLTALSSLIFWLAACDRYLNSKVVDFYLASRKNHAICFECASDLLRHLSSVLTINPKIKGVIENPKKDICIAWTGALKFPLGWNHIMNPSNNSDFKIVRVIQPEQKGVMPEPRLILSPSGGDSSITLVELYNLAIQSIGNFEFPLYPTMVKGYYEIGVAPYIVSHLVKTTDCISKKLHDIKVVNFYSVSAPQIESIALHISLAGKGILPILLSHSFTQSYEFSSTTYKESLSFINSKFILRPLPGNPNGFYKERVVSINKIERQNTLNFSKNSLINIFLAQFKLLYKYKINRWPSLFKSNIIEHIQNNLDKRVYRKSMQSHQFCLGLLLNVESSNFNLYIDFNELFEAIFGINENIHKNFNDVVLSVRAKPGWSNINLLKKSFSKVNSPIICPKWISLLEYGKSCNLVLFIQGTSAIAELMRQGTSCICINSEQLITRLDVEYISYPEAVVPIMTIQEILDKVAVNSQWVSDLGRLQANWIEKQMASTK